MSYLTERTLSFGEEGMMNFEAASTLSFSMCFHLGCVSSKIAGDEIMLVMSKNHLSDDFYAVMY